MNKTSIHDGVDFQEDGHGFTNSTAHHSEVDLCLITLSNERTQYQKLLILWL